MNLPSHLSLGQATVHDVSIFRILLGLTEMIQAPAFTMRSIHFRADTLQQGTWKDPRLLPLVNKGLLGTAAVVAWSGFPAARPTGPVYTSRLRGQEQIRVPHRVSGCRPLVLVEWLRRRLPERRDDSRTVPSLTEEFG